PAVAFLIHKSHSPLDRRPFPTRRSSDLKTRATDFVARSLASSPASPLPTPSAMAASTPRQDLSSGSSGCQSRQLSSLRARTGPVDRKSTRLNSSHLVISYAVFCL